MRSSPAFMDPTSGGERNTIHAHAQWKKKLAKNSTYGTVAPFVCAAL